MEMVELNATAARVAHSLPKRKKATKEKENPFLQDGKFKRKSEKKKGKNEADEEQLALDQVAGVRSPVSPCVCLFHHHVSDPPCLHCLGRCAGRAGRRR